MNNKDLLINEQIRDKEVRVIDENGVQLGIMSIKEALRIAEEKKLDLVKIAPHANPPVCKIMDYGKYKFELAKKEKEAKKNQKVINVKEIRLTTTIEEHDFNVKVKNAIRFLQDGDKVKVSIRFRGREVLHPEIGEEIINKFIEKIKEYGVVEKKPKLDGKNLTAVIAPKQQ
uniref:Translation initiation factor IF-3 n=1 Tax=Caldicellulosiruptor owensensis TaxID=55205 RepID=A0A7C5Z6Q9_9FIRM